MIRETKSDVACAVPKRTPVKREKKREKERKRVKKSEREQTKERKSQILSCFSSEFFVLSRLSLSALSLTLYAKNRHRRKVEKKKRSTKYGRRSSFSQQRRDL